MLKAAYSLAAALLLLPLAAEAKEKVTFAYLLDPVYDAALWPIRNGKVTSDTVEMEARGLDIPALLQATAAKSYDVVMTAVIGIPRAKERGLELQIMATGLRANAKGGGSDIWVKADSPIKTVEDLKGKTIGVYSLPSTGITLIRIALWKKHGINVNYSGGDMKWVELPAPTLPGALSTDKIAAATLIHSQAFLASKGKDYRSILKTSPETDEVLGARAVSAVHVGFPEKLAARPAVFKEFARMLKASVTYTLSHRNEVFPAAGKEANIDPAFFETWFDSYSEIPMAVSAQDLVAIQRVWELSKELGIITSYPESSSMMWADAVRE